MVLPVRPAGHLRATASRRDSEPEHGEPEQHANKDYHGEEVQPQRPGDVEAGAHEAGEGDEEDDEADDEEWRLQHRRARRSGALGQPETGSDDRDRGQERRQVEVADHHVAETLRVHAVHLDPDAVQVLPAPAPGAAVFLCALLAFGLYDIWLYGVLGSSRPLIWLVSLSLLLLLIGVVNVSWSGLVQSLPFFSSWRQGYFFIPMTVHVSLQRVYSCVF